MAVYHKMHDHLAEELLALEGHDPYGGLYSACLGLGFVGTLILLVTRIGTLLESLGSLVLYLFSAIFSFVWIPFIELRDMIFLEDPFDFWGMFPRIISNFFASLWEVLAILWPFLWPLVIGYALTVIIFLLPLPGRIKPTYTGKDAKEKIAEKEAGIEGERRAADILLTLPDTYDVFQNLYFFRLFPLSTSKKCYAIHLTSNWPFLLKYPY